MPTSFTPQHQSIRKRLQLDRLIDGLAFGAWDRRQRNAEGVELASQRRKCSRLREEGRRSFAPRAFRQQRKRFDRRGRMEPAAVFGDCAEQKNPTRR